MTPGSGMEKIQIRDKYPGSYFRELSNSFRIKILGILCCGSGIRWP